MLGFRAQQKPLLLVLRSPKKTLLLVLRDQQTVWVKQNISVLKKNSEIYNFWCHSTLNVQFISKLPVFFFYNFGWLLEGCKEWQLCFLANFQILSLSLIFNGIDVLITFLFHFPFFLKHIVRVWFHKRRQSLNEKKVLKIALLCQNRQFSLISGFNIQSKNAPFNHIPGNILLCF